jgi:hypothetical protein
MMETRFVQIIPGNRVDNNVNTRDTLEGVAMGARARLGCERQRGRVVYSSPTRVSPSRHRRSDIGIEVECPAQDEAARRSIFGDSASAFSSQYVMPMSGASR